MLGHRNRFLGGGLGGRPFGGFGINNLNALSLYGGQRRGLLGGLGGLGGFGAIGGRSLIGGGLGGGLGALTRGRRGVGGVFGGGSQCQLDPASGAHYCGTCAQRLLLLEEQLAVAQDYYLDAPCNCRMCECFPDFGSDFHLYGLGCSSSHGFGGLGGLGNLSLPGLGGLGDIGGLDPYSRLIYGRYP